jgi:hypothetical protein
MRAATRPEHGAARKRRSTLRLSARISSPRDLLAVKGYDTQLADLDTLYA